MITNLCMLFLSVYEMILVLMKWSWVNRFLWQSSCRCTYTVKEFGIRWTKKKGFEGPKSEMDRKWERNRSQLTPDHWDETIDYRDIITSTFCLQPTNEASEDQCSLALTRALALLSCSCHVATTSSLQTYCLWAAYTRIQHVSMKVDQTSIIFSSLFLFAFCI